MQNHLLWLIHFYTSLGIPIAALTLYHCAIGEIKTSFFYMFVAILIDATDGYFARKYNVSKVLKKFDGKKLDDLVDFLNYVLVPVAMAYILEILPRNHMIFGLAPVIASAFGFCQVSAKTEDGFFTGFPSYWNIVIFYLYLFKLSIFYNIIIFIILSAAVFIPIKYITPFKTKPFSGITNLFCVLWCLNLFVIYIFLPLPPLWLIILSFPFPIYYFSISIFIHVSKKINVDKSLYF